MNDTKTELIRRQHQLMIELDEVNSLLKQIHYDESMMRAYNSLVARQIDLGSTAEWHERDDFEGYNCWHFDGEVVTDTNLIDALNELRASPLYKMVHGMKGDGKITHYLVREENS